MMSASTTSLEKQIIAFLAQFVEAQGAFLHSIRSPLSVLLGLVEDLESSIEIGPEDIKDSREAINRIRGLLQQHSLESLRPIVAYRARENAHPSTISLPDAVTGQLDSCTVQDNLGSIAALALLLDGQKETSPKTLCCVQSAQRMYLIVHDSELPPPSAAELQEAANTYVASLESGKAALLALLMDTLELSFVRSDSGAYGIGRNLVG